MPAILPDLPRQPPGSVWILGAGPGDPGLLTLRAAAALAGAEVVIHDRLVGSGVLALAAPGARRIDVGKEGFGPSAAQAAIHEAMIAAAREGLRVVRLKGGDPGVFARLEEELDALDAAGIGWTVVPGITAAAAAAAAIGQSLTARGRNRSLTLLTAHDMDGFAEQDWRALARPGAVAAIYMGRRAARFLQGRLMMHGAAPDAPLTLVENASRADERLHPATLATLPAAAAACTGPAVILWGLAPRAAARALPALKEALP